LPNSPGVCFIVQIAPATVMFARNRVMIPAVDASVGGDYHLE
jgi:hypothetical protein